MKKIGNYLYYILSLAFLGGLGIVISIYYEKEYLLYQAIISSILLLIVEVYSFFSDTRKMVYFRILFGLGVIIPVIWYKANNFSQVYFNFEYISGIVLIIISLIGVIIYWRQLLSNLTPPHPRHRRG